jgi:hypothetical protein
MLARIVITVNGNNINLILLFVLLCTDELVEVELVWAGVSGGH